MRRHVFLTGFIAAAIAFAVPAALAAAEKADAIAVVQAFNDAGNRGDRNAYAGFCTSDAVVIDHLAPFVFRGPTACADDWDAVVAWGKQRNIDVNTMVQTVGNPTFSEFTGDQAYLVFPVTARFTENGAAKEEALVATFVLRREDGIWRISAQTWASLGWKTVPGRQR